MKKHILLFFLFNITLSYAQVGINTANPQGIIHIDGSKNNPKEQVPSNEQQKDDFTVLANGNVGIGTISPENKLHIKADFNPLKLEGLQDDLIESKKLLTINENGIVKAVSLQNTSIPQPAVLYLSENVTNFLNRYYIGQKQTVTPLKLIKNSIPGLLFNSSTSTITFPKGTYEIVFSYEATHNSNNCTLSSYFVDFPSPNGSRRIHNTAEHLQGAQSNHGGTITYTVSLTANETIWPIEFGRGESGNCAIDFPNNTSGMTLFKNSTQVLIFRIGE